MEKKESEIEIGNIIREMEGEIENIECERKKD